MPKVTSLGHIGFYVRDIERSVAFYRDILGLKVSDRSPRGAVFMTAQDRLAEHHELYLAPGRNDDGKANILQQISFRCASVTDVKEFYRIFVENNVPINRCVSHGNTVSIYAEDPDGNRWKSTGPTASTCRSRLASRRICPRAKPKSWCSSSKSLLNGAPVRRR
jgi:catechol 2,3-dioxygenase-like lactoylglutathione lyase family enzyme